MNVLIAIDVLTIAAFIWYFRITKPDKGKLKIVHRSDQDATLSL